MSRKTTIAIQGESASFHDVAARSFFGVDSDRVFCETFDSTFHALQDKEADFAMCAIENSLYGSINEVYDLLTAYQYTIIGEVYLRIEQCLIGLPGASIEDIETVYSHPVALAQCTEFLDKTLVKAKREEHYDTAGSVKLVKDLNNPATAAIAGREAAKLYGLQILADSIETNKENYTRFVCLARSDSADKDSEPKTVADANKTSLVMTTSDDPGALYRALGCFAERDINISKIQSRPIIGKAWSYMFYVDALAGIDNPVLQAALHELTTQGCTVDTLGSYKNALNT
jgi:prephenate dehydratase